MKDFLKKNKINLTVGIYLVAAGALVYFFIMPLQDKIVGKASDIQQEKIDQDITKNKIAMVPIIEKDYQKYKENEESLNIVMDKSQDVEFIKELENLANQTGNKIEFKIQDVKPAATTKKVAGTDIKDKLSYTSFLSMQIAIEGNYQDLLNFMHKLENYHNYVNILSIKSEKISMDNDASGSSSASNGSSEEKKANSREVLNTILDIVVYTKK